MRSPCEASDREEVVIRFDADPWEEVRARIWFKVTAPKWEEKGPSPWCLRVIREEVNDAPVKPANGRNAGLYSYASLPNAAS